MKLHPSYQTDIAHRGRDRLIEHVTTYRVLSDEPDRFTVEIVPPSGAVQIMTGFLTREEAGAWIRERIAEDARRRQQQRRDRTNGEKGAVRRNV